jgi:hypothetical protein
MNVTAINRPSVMLARMRAAFMVVILICLWQGHACVAVERNKPMRSVEDKRFELIHIPLAHWPVGGMLHYKSTFYGFWLDNHQLVISVLQDRPDAYAKYLERIVMIDTRDGSYRVLVEQGSVNCRNAKTKVMAYYAYNLQFYWNNKSRNIVDDYSFIELGDDGQLQPLTGPSPIELNCAPAGSHIGLPPGVRAGKNLKEDHGYIDLSAKDDLSAFKLGTAKLVRPGREPIELGIPNKAVTWPAYLPYWNKYVTGARDYVHGSGGTVFLQHYIKNHPSFGSIYLFDLDGNVQILPDPLPMLEQHGYAAFTFLWPTPSGLLISDLNGHGWGEPGLFLLQGEKLTRLWGGLPTLNPFSRKRGTEEHAYVLNISPDGCRVVFIHSRKFPKQIDKNPNPLPFSILNICKEQ